MKRVYFYLPEETLKLLERKANCMGLTRSEFIREQLSAPSSPSNLTTYDFHQAVAKIRRRYGYGLDRQQTESIVAAVFTELFNRSKNVQDRKLPILSTNE